MLACRRSPVRQGSSVLAARAATAIRVLLKAPPRRGCPCAFPSHQVMVAAALAAALSIWEHTAAMLPAMPVPLGPTALETTAVIYALLEPPTATTSSRQRVSRTPLQCMVTVVEMGRHDAATPGITVC